MIDDFDLLLLLGSGSFARVFLARQISLDRLVALKVSKSVGTEPRTLAQLDHPNIVRVFDQRTCSTTGLRLLYMELVPGGTFQDLVQEVARGPARGADGTNGPGTGRRAVGSKRHSAARGFVDSQSAAAVVLVRGRLLPGRAPRRRTGLCP